MLAELGPAQAGEEALGLIGAGSVMRERDPLVDPHPQGTASGLAPCPHGRVLASDGGKPLQLATDPVHSPASSPRASSSTRRAQTRPASRSPCPPPSPSCRPWKSILPVGGRSWPALPCGLPSRHQREPCPHEDHPPHPGGIRPLGQLARVLRCLGDHGGDRLARADRPGDAAARA